MRIPIALHALTLAAVAAGPSQAQDAKLEEAKPAEKPAGAVRKLDLGPFDVKVFTHPNIINPAGPGIYYAQSTASGQNPVAVEWLNSIQEWQRFGGRGLDGVGADLNPADDAVRAQLNLPEGRGLVVTSVADGGPAARAGLKVNDILLTLDDKPLAKPEDLIATLAAIHSRGKTVADARRDGQQKTPGGPAVEKIDRVSLTLIRDGKPMTIAVKPEVRVILGSVSQAKPNYFIGTPANPIDETLRVHLALPEGHGLIVTEAPEVGTPAARAGIQKNDILLSFNGQLLRDVETLRSAIQTAGATPAKVEVIRAGNPMTVFVTPEPRKDMEQLVSSIDQVLVNMAGQPQTGVQVLQESPYLGRLFRVDNANGQAQAILSPTAYADPVNLSKKIDDLTAQVQALTRAVDELRKTTRTGDGK